MPLFGRKNKSSNKDAKQPIRQGESVDDGGSFLEAIGVSKQEKLTPKQEEEMREIKDLEKVWDYLRSRIDKGAKQYFLEDGNTEILKKYTEQPAFGQIKAKLDELRAQDLVWVQPNRKKTTEAQIKIVQIDRDGKGRPTRFVVRERWLDRSVYARVDADMNPLREREAEGEERVIECVVNVLGKTDWRLVTVERVPMTL